MAIKVLGIAPYPGLRDLLMEIALGEQIEIDVHSADLQEAVAIVKAAENKGYDVILSRGGTASLIREQVSIPVVDIPVSGYDILRIITLIKDSNSKVAIIGFPNICQGATTVSALLDIDIPIYTIHNQFEVAATLEKAFQQGAQIMLGDVVTVRTAAQMGYQGILITSGRESVQESLAEVKRIAAAFIKGQEMSCYFKHLLECAPQGILHADDSGIVQYINETAQEWLAPGNGPLLGQSVKEISIDLSSLINKSNENTIQQSDIRVHDFICKVKVVPVRSKYRLDYFIYLENTGVFSAQSSIIQPPARITTFGQIIGSSRVIQQTIDRAKAFAQIDSHLWISGETGSGKSVFAQAIHSASTRRDHPLYIVSCLEIQREADSYRLFGTDDQVGLLTEDTASTVYLDQIESLPLNLQGKLLMSLRQGVSARLIVSSTVTWADINKHVDFLPELAQLLCKSHLFVPPLRERPEDIDDLIRVMIASHNSQYGKHIVGIRPDVLTRLMKYNWPGNVTELESVIGEMLVVTKNHYVELVDANDVWKRYEVSSNKRVEQFSGIDLGGTWDEIERRILTTISIEEGMNLTKTAKRLGISRTTLWRKLRDLEDRAHS